MIKTIVFSILILLLAQLVNSQTDFDNYTTLLSKGDIPSDFTRETYVKIREDVKARRDLKGTKGKIFLEETNYSVDEILHSGMVIFGDPVTNYIEKVADKLLQNERQLRGELRFYTIKSNIANAFSTDQGIIFVTTGLISQLKCEAQLAYILSHEISHYTQKHVLETYDLATSRDIKNDDRIHKLSQHSKENELEADRLGIKRYFEAGYAKEAMVSTFDVLMYSYLPFDELLFPKTYFNTDRFYVPESLFPSKKYEIRNEENYDDSDGTHPNIMKRKDAALNDLNNFSNWGNDTFTLKKELFLEIRDICRFENIRCNTLNANYGVGLYEIFLMEHLHPNSMFLKRMKAQIWLNLLLFKSENIAAKTVNKTSELEGESASLHFFLKKLSTEAMISLALRQIHDLHKAFPTDDEISTINMRLIAHLAKNTKFKTENFSKKTLMQATIDAANFKAESIKITDTKSTTESKYNQIKNRKNVDLAQNFDSSKFYLYGLWDAISDSLFTHLYHEQKLIHDAKSKEKEAYDLLSRSEKRKFDREVEKKQYQLGLKEVIFVEPMVLSYKHGKVDHIKSERMEKNFSLAIEEAASLSDMTVQLIDSRTLINKGTLGYNERCVLMTLLHQLADQENVEIFPVDYRILKGIQNDFGTEKVMFSLVEHAYSPNISFTGIFSSILIYPAFFVYLPVGLLTGSNTQINVLLLDLNKGTIDSEINYYFKDPPKKRQLGAHIYDIFTKLSTPISQ